MAVCGSRLLLATRKYFRTANCVNSVDLRTPMRSGAPCYRSPCRSCVTAKWNTGGTGGCTEVGGWLAKSRLENTVPNYSCERFAH
ncbi:hypothetical protein PF004_g31601 [Phytophthora fragariae]|uniref:Uncharacterized protein n=1 Tax=Phytophthora fragariae TaxID=53985 RepID=A0A6G0M9K8_9STRA|nr:hypothetical protein PF004_g31601 [Phytophthora fragariae]